MARAKMTEKSTVHPHTQGGESKDTIYSCQDKKYRSKHLMSQRWGGKQIRSDSLTKLEKYRRKEVCELKFIYYNKKKISNTF